MELKQVMDSLAAIEQNLKSFSEKSEAELNDLGKVTKDTETAIENLGIKQREMADELLNLKQRGVAGGNDEKEDESVGAQLVKSDQYTAFASGQSQKARVEVKNTVTNPVGNTYSERRPGVLPGAFRPLTLEDLITALPTSSNLVEYVREDVFTNAASETGEGLSRPESSITTTPQSNPVVEVGHFIKISRQLAADNAALAAYINLRMIYGVNLRVEDQIVSGDGVAPNLSGFTKAGNFTAHGYTDASLIAAGLSNNRFDLIGKMIGDCAASYWPADAIALNIVDWWTTRLAKDANGNYIMGDPSSDLPPILFGLPVVPSNAVLAGKVMVASLANAATMHNRDGVTVELSESDSDNFTKKLVTILAERRTCLAVERPAAVRYGDLIPA